MSINSFGLSAKITKSLHDIAVDTLSVQNAAQPEMKRVSYETMCEVVNRSLASSLDLPAELREFRAMKDLSTFLSLAHYNKVVGPTALNTDLLAVGHPLSTSLETLSYEERLNARAAWFIQDPNALSSAVALIASAQPNTPEMTYAHARLMAAGFPQKYLSALVASFSTGVGNLDGANHGYWRVQRRDRKGRFAWMGGGLDINIRFKDGSVHRLTGRYGGMDENTPDTVDIVSQDNTVYRVPLSKSESFKALLTKGGTPSGYSTEGVDVPAAETQFIADISEIKVLDAPAGWYEIGQPETRPDGSVYRVFTDKSKGVQVGQLKKEGQQDQMVVIDPSKDPSDPEYKVGTASTWYEVDDVIDANTPADVKQNIIAKLSQDYSKELSPEDVQSMLSRGGTEQQPAAPVAEAPAAPATSQADLLDRIQAGIDEGHPGVGTLLKKAKAFIEQGQILDEKDSVESMAEKLRTNADFAEKEDNEPELAKLLRDAADGIEQYKAEHYTKEKAAEETPAAPEPTPEAHPAVDETVPPTAGNVESSAHLTGDEIQAMLDGEGIDDTYDSTTAPAPEEVKPKSAKEAKAIAKEVAPKAKEQVTTLPAQKERLVQDKSGKGRARFIPYTPSADGKIGTNVNIAIGGTWVPANPNNPDDVALAKKYTEERVSGAKPIVDLPIFTEQQPFVDVADTPAPTVAPAEPVQDTLPEMPEVPKQKTKQESIDEIKAAAQEALNNGTDMFGRKLPEGWKVYLNHQAFGSPHHVPEIREGLQYHRSVGKARFTAYLSEDGTLHIVRMGVPDGAVKDSYENWDAFEADMPALHDAMSAPSREDLYKALEIAGITPSDEVRALIDGGASQQEIHDALAKQDDYISMKDDFTNAQWADIMSPSEKAANKRFNDLSAALRNVVTPATKPEPKPVEAPKAEEPVAAPTPEVNIPTVPPAAEAFTPPTPVGAPRKVTTTVAQLLPGDVLVEDHFVVESVFADAESEAKKAGSVWVVGHYAGHVSQKTKLWYPQDSREVYRDVVPPEAGDKPALSKPWMKDFGKNYKDKQTGKWTLVDPAAQGAYDSAKNEYDAALAESKALWDAPTDAPSIDLSAEPAKVYKEAVKAKDLVAGDVTYRAETPNIKYGIEPFNSYFIVEEVFTDENTVAGKISVRGHFEGHASQVKQWNPETPISTIRGIDPTPAGDGPELHRPTLKDAAFQNADGTKNIEAYHQAATEYYNQLKGAATPFETVQSPAEPETLTVPSKPQKPWGLVSPAFFGDKMEKILAAVKSPKQLKEALDQEEVIYFDFETSAQRNDFGPNSVPIQVAAHKVKNGVVTDSITLFMNPAEPLGDFYYKRDKKTKELILDENGNKILDTSIMTPEGQMISDEWLAQQPSVADQMKTFFDWMGESPILAAHNGYEFDMPILNYQAKQNGIDFTAGGQIDTLALAQQVVDPENKKAPRNLGALSERYGIQLEGWHDASADSVAVHGILNGLLDEMNTKGVGWEALDYNYSMKKYEEDGADYIAKMDLYVKQMDDHNKAIFAQMAVDQNAPDVSIDSLLENLDSTPVPNPDGIFNDPAEAANPPFDMPVTDATDTVAWVLDDANTSVLEGKIRPTDFQVGDYIPSPYGFMQITAIEDDPADINRIIVHRKAVGHDYTDIKNWFRYSKTYEGVRRPIDTADDSVIEGQTTIDESLTTDVPSNVQPDMPEMTADQGLTPSFNITNWKKIGGQGGSNAGGVYEDENGDRYYVKFPTNKEHAHSEALASALYVEAGLPVGRVMLGTNDNGDTVLVSPWLADSEKNFDVRYNEPAVRADAQKGFAVDAWLLNWDAVGLAHDNMILVGDSVYRIDPGGALGFRAQGAKKDSSNLTAEVQEIDSMRKHGTAKTVFGGMSDEQIAESVKLVSAISPERIDQLVGMAFPNDDSLATLLKDRRQNLISRFSTGNPADFYADGTAVGRLPKTPEEQAEEDANKAAANPPTPGEKEPTPGTSAFDFNALDGWVTVDDVTGDIVLPEEEAEVLFNKNTGKWHAHMLGKPTEMFDTRKEAVESIMSKVTPKKPALSKQGQDISDYAFAVNLEPTDAMQDIGFQFFPQSEEFYVYHYNGTQAHVKWNDESQGYEVRFAPSDIPSEPKYLDNVDAAASYAIDTLSDNAKGKPSVDEQTTPAAVPAENILDKFLTKHKYFKSAWSANTYISPEGDITVTLGKDGDWMYYDEDVKPHYGFATLEDALTDLDQHITNNAGSLDNFVQNAIAGNEPNPVNVDEHIAFTKESKYVKEDASFIVKQLKAAYPDHKVLENGHIQLFTTSDGKYEYSVNIARHIDEKFTVYGVQTDLQTGEKKYFLNGNGNKRQSFTAILTPLHEIEQYLKGDHPEKLFNPKVLKKKYIKDNLADYDFFDPEVLDINYGIDFTQPTVEGFIGYMSEKSIPKSPQGMTEALYSAIEDMAGDNYAIVTQSMLDSLYNIDGAPKELVDKVIQDLKNTLSDKPVIHNGKIIGQRLPHVYADGHTEAKVGDRVSFMHKGVLKHATVVKLQTTLTVHPKNKKSYTYTDYTRILVDGESTPRTKVSSKLSLEEASTSAPTVPNAVEPEAPKAPKAGSFSTTVISNDFSKTHTLSKEPNGAKTSMDDLVDQGVGYTKEGKTIVLNDETMANLVANNDPHATPASQLKSDDFITFLNEDGTGLDYAQALTVFPDYANEGNMSVIAVMNNGDGTFSAKQFSIPEDSSLTVVRPQDSIASYAKPKTKVTEAEPTVEDVVSFTEAVAQDVSAQGVDTTNADTVTALVNDELVAPKPDAPSGSMDAKYFSEHPDEFVMSTTQWGDVKVGTLIKIAGVEAQVIGVNEDDYNRNVEVKYADGSTKTFQFDKLGSHVYVTNAYFVTYQHKSAADVDYSKTVETVSYKDGLNKKKFFNIKKTWAGNLQVGDLIPVGTGDYRYFQQVLAVHTVESRDVWGHTHKSRYAVIRIIRQDQAAGASHGKIMVASLNSAAIKNVKRPTVDFMVGYKSLDGGKIEKTPEQIAAKAPITKETVGDVKDFNTVQDLADAGSFDKKTPQFYEMFDAANYDEYKNAFKKTGFVVKDGGQSQKYVVPGMVVKDKESGSHGIVENIDANTDTISVLWMSGSKSGTSDENYASKSVEATQHMFTAEAAGELGAVVDGLFEKRVKEEVAKIHKAKADAEAAAQAAAEAAALAKEQAEAHLNVNFPKGSGVDHISVEGDVDWSVTNFAGTHSLVSALDTTSTSKIAGREGIVVITDSDSVEDGKVRIQKIYGISGERKTRLTFKLTDWVGNKKTESMVGSKVKALPAMEVTRYIREDDGTGTPVLKETGTTFDTYSQGMDSNNIYIGGKNKGQTFRKAIYDKDGNEIGYYLFHRADKTTKTPVFETTTKNSSNPAVTFHNAVEIILNDDVTPEQISQALSDAGVAEPRPATKADVLMIAENKVLALFAPKPTSGARNYAGQERIDALAKVKSKYGVDPSEITVEVVAHGRDVQYLLPRSVGEHLAKIANVKSFSHSLNGGGHSSKQELFDRLANQSGLISTYERMMNGINKGGMSSATDVTLAGGQSMFLHQESGTYDPNYKPYMYEGVVYFDAAELLRRVDYYANSGDGYGQKQTNVIFFDRLKGNPHETMFKNGMFWHSVISYGMSTSKRQEVYEMFVQQGIVEIDGKSVKELLGL